MNGSEGRAFSTRRGRQWRYRATALGLSLPLTTAGLLALSELDASAHSAGLSGTATCTSDGTFTIHWTGTTSNVPAGDTALVTTTTHSPAGSSVPGTIATALAANAGYSFDQTGVPGDAGTASVSVHLKWTDTFAADSSNQVGGLTGCTPSAPPPPPPPPPAPPVPVSQQISSHIYRCDNGVPSTSEVVGGNVAISAQLSGNTITSQANPVPVTNVEAGAYTLTATAPAGSVFVSCGGGASIGSPATSALQSYTLGSGENGEANFFVASAPQSVTPVIPTTQTLGAHIYLCLNGSSSMVEINGGQLSATGPQNLAAVGNPLGDVSVLPGDYVISGTAPDGYTFVACSPLSQAVFGPTATTSVNVPVGGAGVGALYVSTTSVPNTQGTPATPTTPLTPSAPAGGSGSGGTEGTEGATTGDGPTLAPPTAVTDSPSLADDEPSSTIAPPAAVGDIEPQVLGNSVSRGALVASLPFTGANVPFLLSLAAVALVAGSAMVWTGRRWALHG